MKGSNVHGNRNKQTEKSRMQHGDGVAALANAAAKGKQTAAA